MASSTFPAVPPVLKPVQTVMKIASDLEKLDPVVAYWCRFYVVQAGLKIDSKSVESRTFLVSIMDWLEKEKKLRHDNESITSEMVAQAHVENYALQIFNKADTDDRAGNANKNTFRLFFISANLFDVLSVFGDVPEEITKRAKYAKWKATYINKCIRNGETPHPGPIAGTDAEEFGEFDPQYGIESNNPEAPSNSNYNESSNFPTSTPTHTPSTQTITPPAAPPRAPTPSSVTAVNGVALNPEDLLKAQKFCKFAGSALQYEDVPTAITNLQKALSLLTTGKENY